MIIKTTAWKQKGEDMENRDPVWLEFQEIVREVCTAFSLPCPVCGSKIRIDRIDLLQIRQDVKKWLVLTLCGSCNKSWHINVNLTNPEVKEAVISICSDRPVHEEARLRTSGSIPPNYERELPELFQDIWEAGPEEKPLPPAKV